MKWGLEQRRTRRKITKSRKVGQCNRPSGFANGCLSRLGFYPPQRLGVGVLFFLMITFQRNKAFSLLRKICQGCGRYISQRDRGSITIVSF